MLINCLFLYESIALNVKQQNLFKQKMWFFCFVFVDDVKENVDICCCCCCYCFNIFFLCCDFLLFYFCNYFLGHGNLQLKGLTIPTYIHTYMHSFYFVVISRGLYCFCFCFCFFYLVFLQSCSNSQCIVRNPFS